MSKLYFKYGSMNSGKSLFLLATAHNFSERNVPYIIIKSTIDTRDAGVIKSRALKSEKPCINISQNDNLYDIACKAIREKSIQWVLVDEAQFLTEAQVDQLTDVVDFLNVDVICYGLRTDFQTKLFPGSKRLFEVADKFEEMKSTCTCGNRASVNARLDKDGNITKTGSQVEVGAEDKYITLCRKCFKKLS